MKNSKGIFLHCTLSIYLLFILFSCDSIIDVDSCYHLPEEIKNWCTFKKGSYWIYTSDSLNIEDSLYVWDYRNFHSKYKDKLPCGERVTFGTHFSKSLMFDGGAYLNSINYNYDGTATLYFNFGVYNANWHISVLYENNSIKEKNTHNKYENIVILFDSTKVLNQYFKEVVYSKKYRQILDSTNAIVRYDSAEGWIAKNVGLIKKVSWINGKEKKNELIRYKLVR